MVFYSNRKRGGEPVVCLFGARKLHDGSVYVGILAVAERVNEEVVEVIEADGKAKMKIRLPERMVGQSVPTVARNVRIEKE